MYKHKWIVFLSVAVVLVLLQFSVPSTDLANRAIVVALSVDASESGKSYRVGAQIITPSEGSSDNKSSGFAVVEAEADSLGEALNLISQKTGQVVSVAHCNIVVFSKEILSRDVLPDLNYLISAWDLPEISLITATDNSAIEILTAHVTITKISGFHLLQAILVNGTYSTSVTTSIKDFIVAINSKGATVAVPRITIKEVNRDKVNYTMTSDDVPLCELHAETAYLYKKGGKVAELSVQQTRDVNFLLFEVSKGELYATADGINSVLEILKKSSKIKFDVSDGKNKISVKLQLKLSVAEVIATAQNIAGGDLTKQQTEALEQMIAAQISADVLNTLKLFTEEDFDLVLAADGLYRKGGEKWKQQQPEGWLNGVEYNVEVKADIVK